MSLFLFTACARPPEGKPAAPAHAAPVAAPAPVPTSAPPSQFEYDADGFVYARLEEEPAPVPARFSAKLPSSLEAFERTEAYPPRGQVGFLLCNGDAEVRQRWLEAVRAAAARGDVDAKLRGELVALLGFCPAKPFCEWLAASAVAERERGARRVLHEGLTQCGHTALSVLERDAEAELLVELYSRTFGPDLPFSPRFEKAVAELVKTRRGKELRTIAVTLSRIEDERVVAFVEKLRRSLDSESRAWLGLAFQQRSNQEARFRESCEHPAVAKDPVCHFARGRELRLGLALWEVPLTFQEQVMQRRISSAVWLAEHPDRKKLLKLALVACTRRAEVLYRRNSCLDDLAAYFWSDARALLLGPKPPEFEDEPYHWELASALRRFDSRDGLVEHLRAQALLPEGFALRAGKEDHLTTVREILSAAGRLHEFDVETDQSPNEHDALLVELAALVGEELAGVRFEENASDPDSARGDESSGAEPYRLHAYADGKRYSLEATNYGDRYDFVAVLGLLNSLLRERGSSVRFLSLYVGDQWANVVFGKRDSLAELVKDGLLVAQGPESAREVAQELELGAFGDED